MKYAILVVLLLAIAGLWYRLEVWNLHNDDKRTLLKLCSNYGDNRFCNCFIERLNNKMPAKDEIILLKRKGTMPQFETDAVKKCI